MEDYNKKVGLQIRQARKNKRLSMKELGELVNLHESTVSRYEKGEIQALNIEKLKEFANALDIPPEHLLNWTDNKINNSSLPHINIKELRLQKGWSEMEMAREFNISIEDLKAYEKGLKKVPFEFLKQLADYFDIDMSRNIGLNYTKDINEGTFGASMRVLEITKRWNDEVGETSFSNDEITKLIEYAKFLISQRK